MASRSTRYQLDLSVTGVEHAVARTNKLASRMQNPRPALEEVVDVLIDTEKTMWNKGWKVLDPDTVATKKRKGVARPRRKGTESGALERSLTEKGAQARFGRAARRGVRRGGQVIRYSRMGVFFGTSLPHAHLFDRGRKGQPARKLIRLNKSARVRIADAVRKHLVS